MREQTARAIFRNLSDGSIVAKNQNTFEKRRRESDKKRKAEEKREKRRVRKEQPDADVPPVSISETGSDQR